jgi:hypothetical protein
MNYDPTPSKTPPPPSYAYMVQENSITVHFSDGDAFTWPKDHLRFGAVRTALSEMKDEGAIRALMDTAGEIRVALQFRDFTVTARNILYKDRVVDLPVVSKILKLQSEGLPIEPALNFLERLIKNPRRSSVESLYDFLSHNSIPLTQDGKIVVYKKVRSDYKDIHSGTIDNSPGQSPEMMPWEVDEDRNRPCSNGLHVCGRDYLPSFGLSEDDRVVICIVDPEHVIAVPADYQFAKMRVYKYDVVGELKDAQKAELIDKCTVLSSPGDMTDYVDWDDEFYSDEDYNEYDDDDDCDSCLETPLEAIEDALKEFYTELASDKEYTEHLTEKQEEALYAEYEAQEAANNPDYDPEDNNNVNDEPDYAAIYERYWDNLHRASKGVGYFKLDGIPANVRAMELSVLYKWISVEDFLGLFGKTIESQTSREALNAFRDYLSTEDIERYSNYEKSRRIWNLLVAIYEK